MTASAAEQLIPQPPATVAALPAFTRELDQAADRARQECDLTPLRRFVAQWSVHVHIQRQPQLAEELRRCEEVAETGDTTQARRASSEISKILDEAHSVLSLPAR